MLRSKSLQLYPSTVDRCHARSFRFRLQTMGSNRSSQEARRDGHGRAMCIDTLPWVLSIFSRLGCPALPCPVLSCPVLSCPTVVTSTLLRALPREAPLSSPFLSLFHMFHICLKKEPSLTLTCLVDPCYPWSLLLALVYSS